MIVPTFLAAALMVVSVGCKPPAPPEVVVDETVEVDAADSNTTAAAETPAAVVETPAAEEAAPATE